MDNTKERMGGKGGMKMPPKGSKKMPGKGMHTGARVSHGPGTKPKGKGSGMVPRAKKMG